MGQKGGQSIWTDILRVALAGILVMATLSLNLPAAEAGVGIVYFDVRADNHGQIVVEWETAIETDVIFFVIKRHTTFDLAAAVEVNRQVPRGGGVTGAEYEFVDRGLTPDQVYYYWLLEITATGNEYLLTSGAATTSGAPWNRYWFPLATHT